MAGPANIAALAIVLPTTFAAVSSSGGVATSDGISAACAGGKQPETIVDVTAST